MRCRIQNRFVPVRSIEITGTILHFIFHQGPLQLIMNKKMGLRISGIKDYLTRPSAFTKFIIPYPNITFPHHNP
jgi:hypothetical protein